MSLNFYSDIEASADYPDWWTVPAMNIVEVTDDGE